MIKTDFLHQLDKLSLILNKRVTSNFVGQRKSLALGRGIIFSDYGRYAYGDDFRAIDWKVYARTDKLFIKRYEEERNLTVHVVVDFSGSMNFGKGIKKSEYASMMALGFCHVALRNNEKFMLSTFSERLAKFRPKRGAKQLAAILQYLNNKKPMGKTKFEESLLKYKEAIKTKSMIIFISDFFYDINEIKSVLARFKKSKVILIQVLDEQEKNLDLEGDYELVDLETEASMKTYVDPLLKKQYLTKLEYHNEQIHKACLETKASFYSVDTGKQIFDAFYEILARK